MAAETSTGAPEPARGQGIGVPGRMPASGAVRSGARSVGMRRRGFRGAAKEPDRSGWASLGSPRRPLGGSIWPSPGAGGTVSGVDPVRFLADSSLDLVARRLRVLGFDVVTVRDARLEDLFEAARRDGRTVLTTSARHPRRHADVGAITLPREAPQKAVRAVAEAHASSGPPFSRCPICNHELLLRTPAEGSGKVPDAVLRAGLALRSCPGCGRWYWHGSHVDRLRRWLGGALGRDVPPAGAPG